MRLVQGAIEHHAETGCHRVTFLLFNLCALAWPWGRWPAGLADAGRGGFRRLIRGVLGHEVACEGAGEDALIKAVRSVSGPFAGPRSEAVDSGEGGFFNPADDFAFVLSE